jgi:hypothetical protein
MRWAALALLLILSACIPSFEEAKPEQLTLTYQDGTLELTSDRNILRGSVGIRAESVVSIFCAVPGCVPDSEGRVLLQLKEGVSYTRTIILGRATGLQRVKAAIVRQGERKAVERLWEFH